MTSVPLAPHVLRHDAEDTRYDQTSLVVRPVEEPDVAGRRQTRARSATGSPCSRVLGVGGPNPDRLEAWPGSLLRTMTLGTVRPCRRSPCLQHELCTRRSVAALLRGRVQLLLVRREGPGSTHLPRPAPRDHAFGSSLTRADSGTITPRTCSGCRWTRARGAGGRPHLEHSSRRSGQRGDRNRSVLVARDLGAVVARSPDVRRAVGPTQTPDREASSHDGQASGRSSRAIVRRWVRSAPGSAP
jgi:hypothetical protein